MLDGSTAGIRRASGMRVPGHDCRGFSSTGQSGVCEQVSGMLYLMQRARGQQLLLVMCREADIALDRARIIHNHVPKMRQALGSSDLERIACGQQLLLVAHREAHIVLDCAQTS